MIVRERTKLLLVLAPPGGDAMRLTDEIAEASQGRLRAVERPAGGDGGLRLVLTALHQGQKTIRTRYGPNSGFDSPLTEPYKPL